MNFQRLAEFPSFYQVLKIAKNINTFPNVLKFGTQKSGAHNVHRDSKN